jgi:YbgC/YbaW family acyl-CoA thioester hydrolase
MKEESEKTYTYYRKAQYHETDQMGIIHHSNYVKWMEEARIGYMSRMGFSYKKVEELGVIQLHIESRFSSMMKSGSALALSSIMEFLWNLIMNFLMRAEMKSAQPLIPDIVF